MDTGQWNSIMNYTMSTRVIGIGSCWAKEVVIGGVRDEDGEDQRRELQRM